MSLRTIPARRVDCEGPLEIVEPTSPIFACGNVCAATGGVSSGAWWNANDPIALPFFLDRQRTVFQLGWINGSGTMTDNTDVGIYSTAWARLISTGSTARSGVSSQQWVDVADTVLASGKYYLCASNNGTTANQFICASGAVNSVPAVALLGCIDSATDAFPLPNPLTNMAAAIEAPRIPMLLMAFRSVT